MDTNKLKLSRLISRKNRGPDTPSAMNASGAILEKIATERPHGVLSYVPSLRASYLLSMIVIALAADYAWMLYMRWRMVIYLAQSKYSVLTNESHQDPSRGRYVATRSACLMINHGITLRSWRKTMILP
jgi:hypothetical protein